MTTPTFESGSLSVLNTGAGDIVVSFNDHDDAEIERAIKMLEDMQQRGYAILVRQADDTYLRAVAINRETKSYVVVPPAGVELPPELTEKAPAPKRRGRKPGSTNRRRVEQPIKTHRGVGVARSAGGCARRTPTELFAMVGR